MAKKPTKPTPFNSAVKISRKAARDRWTRDRRTRDFEAFLAERLPTIVETILAEVLELRNQLEDVNRGRTPE